jgi:hypothetical protein
MARPIDRRLDRVEDARTAATRRSVEEVDTRLATARAKVAIGAVVRRALLRAGVDPTRAPRLSLADEAAALLAAAGETPSEPDETAPLLLFDPTRPPTPFETRILALAECFTDGSQPDFAAASFAELFAWSLVRLSAETERDGAPRRPSPPPLAAPFYTA